MPLSAVFNNLYLANSYMVGIFLIEIKFLYLDNIIEAEVSRMTSFRSVCRQGRVVASRKATLTRYNLTFYCNWQVQGRQHTRLEFP